MTTPILIITGPTAIGKTAYALQCAEEQGADIISADSMQVYRYMDIGTAKPTLAELARVPHHMIDIVAPDQPFNVTEFVSRFTSVREELISRGRPFIVVGGTGLYLRALIEGLSFPEAPPDMALRAQLEREAAEQGSSYLHDRLKALDPAAAERLHPNDHFRLTRALEVVITTGKPLGVQQKKGVPLISSYRLVCLTAPRETIYERIDRRVDMMFEQGLIEEVQKLLSMGYNKYLTSLQALGYKETIEYLDGALTKDALIERIKRKTRNFAKRQLTWFRSFEGVVWQEIE